MIKQVESGVGSPVEVARSYMKEKAPWASPTKHVEFRSPLTTRMKLFKEGTPYSLNHDYLSSSKVHFSLFHLYLFIPASAEWISLLHCCQLSSQFLSCLFFVPSLSFPNFKYQVFCVNISTLCLHALQFLLSVRVISRRI